MCVQYENIPANTFRDIIRKQKKEALPHDQTWLWQLSTRLTSWAGDKKRKSPSGGYLSLIRAMWEKLVRRICRVSTPSWSNFRILEWTCESIKGAWTDGRHVDRIIGRLTLLSPRDALKRHFKSLKTDLIFPQLKVLERKFLWNRFTNTWHFFFTHFKSSSSTISRELRQQFAICSVWKWQW